MKTATTTPPLTPATIRDILTAQGLVETLTKPDGPTYVYGNKATEYNLWEALGFVSLSKGKPTVFWCSDDRLVFGYGAPEPAEPPAQAVVPPQHCPTCSCPVEPA